jgi:hypothetical protein
MAPAIGFECHGNAMVEVMMVSTVVEAVGGAMQDRDSFYYRAIRTKLGDVARTQYDLKEPLPETPTKELFELYEKERVAAGATGNPWTRGRS